MGVAMVSGLALVGAAPARAVTADAKASFIAGIVTPAQKAQRQFGVPASVSIAQAIVAPTGARPCRSQAGQELLRHPVQCDDDRRPVRQAGRRPGGQAVRARRRGSDPPVDPAKFDCSELVQWLFGRSGNPITDLAASQYNVTKKVTGSPRTSATSSSCATTRPVPTASATSPSLTKKLCHGDWRVIEARGRAYGVVRTTLSYWKQRVLLRRPAALLEARASRNGDGVEASAARVYQSGCVTISSRRYAKFGSGHRLLRRARSGVVKDSGYKAARGVINNIPAFVDAIAKVEEPKDAATYAKTINGLIASYKLTDYDVVPFDLVLLSGDKGTKVSAHAVPAARQRLEREGHGHLRLRDGQRRQEVPGGEEARHGRRGRPEHARSDVRHRVQWSHR